MEEGNTTVLCEVVNENTVSCEGEEYHDESLLKPGSALFWVYLVLYMVLVLFAGVCVPPSQLTVCVPLASSLGLCP